MSGFWKYSGYSINSTCWTIDYGSGKRREFKNNSQVSNVDDWVGKIPEAEDDIIGGEGLDN